MISKKIIILGLIIGSMSLYGCSNIPELVSEPILKTYSNNDFSIEYPDTYTLEETKTQSGAVWVTISNGKGRIEINGADYAEGPHPTVEELGGEEKYKEFYKVFPKESNWWGRDMNLLTNLFYEEGDKETMEELRIIEKSVKNKKAIK